MRSYYEILNVSRDAEHVVIKAAYRAMMAKYHPDTSEDGPAGAEPVAKLINEAYATLRDPARRKSYDAWLRHQEAEPGKTRSQEAERPRSDETQTSTSRPTASAQSVYKASTESDERGLRHPWLVLALPLLAWIAIQQVPTSPNATHPASAPNAETSATADDFNAIFGPGSKQPTPGVPETEAAVSERVAANPADAEATGAPTVRDRAGFEQTSAGGDNSRPDLSRTSVDDRQTIELACVMESGIVAKNGCLRREASQLTGGNRRPDFSRISADDRQTIELACVMESGIVAKNGCLRREASQLTGANRRPDFSRISAEDRQTIELACVMKSGIVAKNRCLRDELRSLTGQ